MNANQIDSEAYLKGNHTVQSVIFRLNFEMLNIVMCFHGVWPCLAFVEIDGCETN